MVSAAPVLLLQLLVAPGSSARAQPLDSLRILRDARRAQADFEGQRRHKLPVAFGGSGGRCDVRLGRFCYWHDEGAERGPQEPASIAPLRVELTKRLGDAAARLPGDAWIVGQRVRYLVESGNHRDGLMAAGEDCRAAAWWCSALTGLVLHAAQYVTAADSAFALALEGMPGDRRCSWEDASDLLPPRAARIYRALSCEERRHWLAPVWTLADPSWTRAGNDRRTEHYARLVMSQLDRQSRSAYSMSWGGDTHELIVRYGWPERWSRGSAPTLDPSNINVIGHEPHPAFDFFPDDSAIGVPSMIAPSRWNYRDPTARSRYAPPYARRVVPLESQVAAFRRGDSALVVAAFNAPADTAFDPRSLTAAIGIDHDLARPNTTVVPVTVQDGRTRARIAVPPSTCEPRADSTTACPGSDALLVGLELSDSSHRSLAIARHWLPMQAHGDLGLLLYADPRGTDATLDDVLPRALGAFRTSRRDRLGLYWEYDHAGADADSVRTVLTVYPRSASWLTRLARSMRLAEAAAPVHVEFTEPLSGGMRHTRTLGVSLAHLPPGTYDVRVRIETNAREISRTTRTLALTP